MITTEQRPSMRERLIESATGLFYMHGLRAVSVEKVIARADTTKVTFYRHFQSKDDLVVAYLEHFAMLERDGIGTAIAHGDGDVDASLQLISELIGTMACSAGFRGCPFINAAAEYPDPESSVRKTVDTQRSWCKTAFRDLVAPLGMPDATALADVLMLLRDGAMVAGYLSDPATVATSYLRGCRAVVHSGATMPVRP